MNYSLTEFFKISKKIDHNADLLKQSLKIFMQYKQEFQNNYINFLEISKITKDNIEMWKTFPDLCSEIKDKSDMSIV